MGWLNSSTWRESRGCDAGQKSVTTNWDKGLEETLFGLRSVVHVHDSTGFTLAELMLGHMPRGLRNILKESWEALSPLSPTSALSYLTDLIQGQMVRTLQWRLRRNVTMARSYDLKAKTREFSIGDLVLILIPSSTHRLLLAHWQVPYPVIAELSSTTTHISFVSTRRESPNGYIISTCCGIGISHHTIYGCHSTLPWRHRL